jgi:hypothetical protein
VVELYLRFPIFRHGVLGQIYSYHNLSVEIMVGLLEWLDAVP